MVYEHCVFPHPTDIFGAALGAEFQAGSLNSLYACCLFVLRLLWSRRKDIYLADAHSLETLCLNCKPTLRGDSLDFS